MLIPIELSGRNACRENTITIIINGNELIVFTPMYEPTSTTNALPSAITIIIATTYGMLKHKVGLKHLINPKFSVTVIKLVLTANRLR